MSQSSTTEYLICETKLYNLSTRQTGCVCLNGDFKSRCMFTINNMIDRDELIEYIQFSVPNAVIPVSFYTINENNNLLVLYDLISNTTANITFPYGNYTANTFIAAFNVNPLITGEYFLQLNPVTSKLALISSNTCWTLKGSSTISSIMGFANDLVSDIYYSLLVIDSTNNTICITFNASPSPIVRTFTVPAGTYDMQGTDLLTSLNNMFAYTIPSPYNLYAAFNYDSNRLNPRLVLSSGYSFHQTPVANALFADRAFRNSGDVSSTQDAAYCTAQGLTGTNYVLNMYHAVLYQQLEFPRTVNFLPLPRILLRCSEMANTSMVGSKAANDIVLTIPNNAKPNGQIYFQNTSQSKLLFRRYDLQQFIMLLTDDDGNCINFNGISSFYTLQFDIFRRWIQRPPRFASIIDHVNSELDSRKELMVDESV